MPGYHRFITDAEGKKKGKWYDNSLRAADQTCKLRSLVPETNDTTIYIEKIVSGHRPNLSSVIG